jgi:hypothetical protein
MTARRQSHHFRPLFFEALACGERDARSTQMWFSGLLYDRPQFPHLASETLIFGLNGIYFLLSSWCVTQPAQVSTLPV